LQSRRGEPVFLRSKCTGLPRPPPKHWDTRCLTYGVVISGTNCSASARLLLWVGLQKQQLPDVNQIWKRIPTIWQYARNAKFKTILIDTWNRFGTFHSYMNTEEALQIDEFITVLELPYYKRDPSAADKILEVFKRDEPMFIYEQVRHTFALQ
jgi:hypothetical protein